MMDHLFIFTIGPVKGFIENSRKAKDLYAGSRLLSEFMREAVRFLRKREGVHILFPQDRPMEALDKPNIPNRLIASITQLSDRQIEEMADALTVFVKDVYLSRCLSLLRYAGVGEEGLGLARRQLQNFLEVYWMAVPYESESYAAAYNKLFQGIQEVKGVRAFTQTAEPGGRKCTLFPEYNAIFAKKRERRDRIAYPTFIDDKYACDITDNVYLRYKVKSNEALSAIGLVKRVYENEEGNIYSIRQMLLRNRMDEKINQVLSERDGDMIANIIYDWVNENTTEEDDCTEEALAHAKILYRYIKNQKIKLSSYYALVKFDGDGMGDEFRKRKTWEEQKELSDQISQFAVQAMEIFRNNGGLPVYAGGEDFLGFLPLDRLFVCLQELSSTFFSVTGLTFSAGIVVAHLMQLLKEVMEEAEKLEGKAKEMEGKNAFVIGIIKRSGETVYMPPCKFTAASGQSGPELKSVQRLVDLLRGMECSKALLFRISDLFQNFRKENTMPEYGVARILIRECVHSADIDREKTNVDILTESLLVFYREDGSTDYFLNSLNAILFLAREVV